MSGVEGQRIIHVPRRYVREEWGGTESVVWGLCQEQLRAGWRPEVVTSLALSRCREERMGGVPVKRFGYGYPYFGLSPAQKAALDKKGGNLVSFPLFRHLLTVPEVRLFHAHALKRLGGEVMTAARWRRKPCVVSIHGGFFDVPEEEQASLRQPVQGRWEWGKVLGAFFGSRRILEQADMVICVGHGEYDAARQHLSHDRIAYLPNGVETGKFDRGDGQRFRRAHGISPATFVVLSIGRIDAQKNQELLLRAFARFQARRRDSRLVLAGPVTQPDYERRLRRILAVEGLENLVHWLGPVSFEGSDLADVYQASDLMVVPSRHEPFGIVVLEAWCCRKPVIASSVGGMRHLVEEDRTGLFVDPTAEGAEEVLAQRMEQLAGDPERARRLGLAGREEVEKVYDWRRIAGRLEALYQRAEGR